MSPRSEDFRFNRIRKAGKHIYLKEYENGRIVGEESYEGYIKCKLVHNDLYSLVLPDQIYVKLGGEIHWVQPLYFSGCLIAKLDEYGTCQLSIDASHCVVLNITFNNKDLVNRFDDGSLFYKCEIKAPKYLYQYTTGLAKFVDNKPYLKLHHHTSHGAKESILKGSEFWSSDWNIQGTKRLTNIGYLYLTSLPSITCVEDLSVIAMSSDGRLGFRTDQNDTGIPDLILDVYRESTTNRTETLSHWVDTTHLASQPSYRHQDPGGFGFHEIVCPFVHRLGVEHSTIVQISDDQLVPVSPKNFDYAVVGDATRASGLAAPYDEEETEEVFKIEHIVGDEDIISFWIANANTDQFSGKVIEKAEFS
ncbi:hypothetical protein [Solemya pervernicosa gill symbiont]|uniref:hypothetical protein n=1 Tax=Solemya pervernicosa gill symbiont TaxID=642797 RepID=UPI0010844A23|nr:hypothetical protein [Solemya pervernicosa gill symbiont]